MTMKKNVSEQEAALIFCQSGALEDCGSMLERIGRRFNGVNADDMNNNDLFELLGVVNMFMRALNQLDEISYKAMEAKVRAAKNN